MTGTLPNLLVASLRQNLRRPRFHHAKIGNQLAIAVFALFLAVPFAGSFLRKPSVPYSENRTLHPKPDWPSKRWQFQTFPWMFDRYFGDRLGFRPELLALRRRILLEALDDSTADLVWVGRDGWLFTNTIGPFNLPPPPAEAERRLAGWVDALRARRDWLAKRGIRYVVVVAPEKSHVYPELLPATIHRHPPPDRIRPLKDRLGDLIVDPTAALLAAKATTPQLYFQLDTHWTDAGAFVAYRELDARLARELPGFLSKPMDRIRPRPWHTPNCDLARALGRPPNRCDEVMAIYDVPHDPFARLPNDPIVAELNRMEHRLAHIEPLVVEAPNGVGRALFLHDSFGHNLKRLWASDFRRLVCAGTYGFPTDVIEAEKPDVVIQLFVARAVSLTDAIPIRLE